MERTPFRRKIMRIGFWVLILYTAFISTVVVAIQIGFIPMPRSSYVQADEKSASTSETAFAQEFAREYLFWTAGKETSRVGRLQRFWAPGVDAQGGLNFAQVGWNSYTQNVDVWEVKPHVSQPGVDDITLYAETILTNVKNTKQQKRVDRYLVITVQKAGDSYMVISLPRLITPPTTTLLPTSVEQGTPVSTDVSGQVSSFMQSFWETYTTGTPQEIANLMKDGQAMNGLVGIMEFKKLKQISVQKLNGQIMADCDVVMVDLASGAEVTSHYTLQVESVGDRWYVINIQ